MFLASEQLDSCAGEMTWASVVSVCLSGYCCFYAQCSVCQAAEHEVLYAGLFVQSLPSSAFFLLSTKGRNSTVFALVQSVVLLLRNPLM